MSENRLLRHAKEGESRHAKPPFAVPMLHGVRFPRWGCTAGQDTPFPFPSPSPSPRSARSSSSSARSHMPDRSVSPPRNRPPSLLTRSARLPWCIPHAYILLPLPPRSARGRYPLLQGRKGRVLPSPNLTEASRMALPWGVRVALALCT